MENGLKEKKRVKTQAIENKIVEKEGYWNGVNSNKRGKYVFRIKNVSENGGLAIWLESMNQNS